jgi:hypothetical protein
MRLAPLILAAFLVPAASHAAGETVSVRAGEHGDYSRLVIPNAPEGWRIATSDRKIEITFPQQDYAFELSDIVDRRKAHRVLNARVIDAEKTRSLVLSLTCDCPVRTSKSADSSIVIDIFSDTPVALSPEEEAPAQQISEAAKNAEPATPESMRAARDRMIALLAEARDQGVVQLKIDDARAAETPAPAEPQHAEPATPVTPASHETAAHPAPQADGPPQPLLASAETPDQMCGDPALFNEPEDGEMNFSAIASLRQKYELTLDDEERDDLAAALGLAYIQIGFFEEASAVASPLARSGDADMALAAGLAEIASGSQARAQRHLSPFRACGAFHEMAYAAAAPSDDEAAVPMTDKHVTALKPLVRSLRGPLAEALGLNALERGEKHVASAFYTVAKEARGKERTPAIIVLENALAGEMPAQDEQAEEQGAGHAPAAVNVEELQEIAQTPGPLQAKALSILAEDYQKRANAAYEGFLDDVASQSSRKGASLSEARSSFAGAKALVGAGRLGEGVTILNNTAKASPAAREASQALARSIIMNALMQDDKTRLEAVAAFFHNRDFLEIENDGDLNIAVARELAGYGAGALVDEALEGVPAAWSAQADAMKALSRLNGGDAEDALMIASRGKASSELALIGVKANEKLDNSAGAAGAIRNALKSGAADPEFASAAWRSGDWSLAVDAFEKTPKKNRKPDAAARAALAALNGGAELPASVREALAADPRALAALAHMFATAPAVNIRAIDVMSDFATGVAKETDFMETGLAGVSIDAGGE